MSMELQDSITREKVEAYEKVRQSGKTNMINILTVIHLSNRAFDRKECMEIMKNYGGYIDKYKIERK